MKIIIFLIPALLLTILIPITYAACINTADDYSVEVVLNKPGIEYKLDLLNNLKNVELQDNRYILQSEYSSNLAVILEKQSGLTSGSTSGLSVRLQIPVKSEDITLPYLKFISSSAKGIINTSLGELYNGWKISCLQGSPIPECEFIKEKTNILASLISSNKYEITIETNKDLKDCTECDGRCLIGAEPRCIDRQLKNDIEDILKYSGLINSFEELTFSYRGMSVGNIIVTDLAPAIKTSVDWQEAMRQELVRLRGQNIILITTQDIEEIAKLARQGAAGQNSRIAYGQDKNNEEKWLYYYQTKFPVLTKLTNCQEFSISLVPTGAVSFNGQEISTYYLIPIALTSFLLVLFLVLILVARMIETRKRKKKIKPITSLSQT